MNDVKVLRTVDSKNEKKLLEMPSIYRAAKLANLAYMKESVIHEHLVKHGASKIFIYSYEGMLAFMAEFQNYIVVSFRGIGTKDDIKTIFKFWKKECKGVKVHAGFSNSVDKFSRYIINDIETMTEGKEVMYTGHSFGGAMALLLTLNYKPDIICTFGAPKAGGGDNYLRLFEGVEVIRAQTQADFIPILPPNIPLFLEYEHIGRSIMYDTTPQPFEAHTMKTYLRNVAKNNFGENKN